MTKNMTSGNPAKLIFFFALPLIIGNIFQQFYSMADTMIVGRTIGVTALAAVGCTGSLSFFIIGFVNGFTSGLAVITAQRFGAKDMEGVKKSFATGILLTIFLSIGMTILAVLIARPVLELLQTPAEILDDATSYITIIFVGIGATALFNLCSNMLRALGDSIHPLYYLLFSSIVNILLDLLFVAHPAFHWGVAGAAVATVISQGLSVILCLFRMCRLKDYTRLDFRKIRYHAWMMKQVLHQGLPSGIQNAVITVGNLVIQKNINSFGAYAMSGMGAYSKIEGFVFLPIMSMAMALPTFVSQNLGARQYHRAKKGAVFGILFGMITAEVTGLLIYFFIPYALKIFGSTQEAIAYGTIHAHIVSLFFFLLAFSHCAAGVMRGCGYAVVPMAGMLLFWCGLRIVYVTTALRFFPVFQMISWAYPLTWGCSTILFLIFLFKADWQHHLD